MRSDFMNRIAIVAKNDELSQHIKEILLNRLKEAYILDVINPDLVICVGGDGTFLVAVHQYIEKNPAFLGIHTGTLGFYTDYTADEIEECIQNLLNQEVVIEKSPLLQIDLMMDKGKKTYYALNEMRIENVIRTLAMDVFIDGEYFESYRGTGLCVCTQQGSTAYNRSLKGAVIDEHLHLMQLHEITGIHHSKYRSLGVPLLLNQGREITFRSHSFKDSILCYDHLHESLEESVEVKVRLSQKKISFARYRKISYLARLRQLF